MLNVAKLQCLNHLDGVQIDFYNTDYAAYDVVLFMGYDPEVEQARTTNPTLKIGIIDPRPQFMKEYVGMDFILANGIEMRDWYIKYTHNVFIYYIYPHLSRKVKLHEHSRNIIVGYHGDPVHLKEMYPRITAALEALAEGYTVELWAMYNIAHYGEWTSGLPDPHKVKVKHIQWSEENYDTYISKVNIGLIPNVIPINKDIMRVFSQSAQPQKRNSIPLLTRLFGYTQQKSSEPAANLYREHLTDYLIRYKATSNPGRIFVFAQYGIPVIADMFPSALQIIEDGVNGFVCYRTEAWYWALKTLADNPAMRTEFSQNMTKTFDKIAAPDVLNQNLVHFIRNI